MVSMRVVLAAAAVAVLSTASVDARRQFGLHGTTSTADAVAARTVHGAHSSLWVRQQRADPSQTIAFKFIVHPQTSVDTLDAMVKSVSDVASNSYGQYLSNDELRKHTGPSHEVTSTLTSFLTNHSDDVDVSANGDAIIVRMPIATAEKLFATTMFEYQHRDKDLMKVVRPHHQGFSVPSTIADHVMFIDGLESFPTPRQAQLMMQDGDPFAIKSTTNDNAAKTDILVTPGIIRAQYDVPDDIRRWNGTHPKNKLVVSAFLNEYYTEQDLSSFLAKYESRSVHKGFKYPAHTGDCIAGAPGSAGVEATGEASLDVQVTVSLSRSENIEMLCFQNNRDPTKPFADDNQEPFLEFMQTVNAMDPAPSVVSISYTDEECAVPAGYRDAVNLEFMKAALKGISIIISAGDAGVQGSHMSDFCHIAPCSKFVAMFPVSSPYVTAVGATSLDASSFHNGKYKERVTTSKNGDLITSGGGFSAVYAQPDYQAKAVQNYLKFADDTKLTPLFNPKGRAYPDITALGHSFPVFQSGQVWRTDGTSVSAPIIASLVTLLSKHRLEHGHSALGFLNPLIYKLYDVCPQVFRDITEGDIKCGGSGGDCCERGHEARVGWDAVSGVGTLKFGTLVSNLQQCIDKIKLQATNHVLLDDQEVGLSQQFQVDMVTQQVERVGAVLVFVAAVALVGFLVTVRRKLFPGRRLLDLYQYEPARQHLLADQE